MAGMHLIVRPNLDGCQSLAHDRLLANDRLAKGDITEQVRFIESMFGLAA
jgi:hypothetical protein